jgi:crossover junction endodeoxyribonuclease RuvC
LTDKITEQSSKRIIGIDPGSRFCGYGILDIERKKIAAAGCSVIQISDRKPLTERLRILYDEICKVLDEYKPNIAAIETMFYGKNFQGIFSLGHARGVILLALSQRDIPIHEYSPREVKKAVTGNGNASKQQIRYMIAQLLPLTKSDLSSDAADALAIAMCHHNRNRI